MNADLSRFLATRTQLAQETAVWPMSTLAVSAYLDIERPPLKYVTSVRAFVFRGGSLLVARNRDGTHVWPGGRREKGERLKQTLRREVLEETGWKLRRASLVGFLHLHHLSPKPSDYAYPYPDFMHLVYMAEAGDFVPEFRDPDGYELDSAFVPVDEARTLSLSACERALLDAALPRRTRSLSRPDAP